MLRLEEACAGYRGLEILQDVSLDVGRGEVVALIGANGAGKTTTLRAISGLLGPTSGRIEFEGESIGGKPPHEIVRAGIVQVPEGRELFGRLTVLENLRMGAYTRDGHERDETLGEVHELFPLLDERGGQLADTLSGGEQQMLAIARALMARPKLLMLDEPSLGLAPKLVTLMFEAIERIRELGITVLIVEQNVAQTLRLADRAFVLESGRIVAHDKSGKLLNDPRIRSAYLGV